MQSLWYVQPRFVAANGLAGNWVVSTSGLNLCLALLAGFLPNTDMYSVLLCDAMGEYDAGRGHNTPLQFLLFTSRCRRASAGSIVHASCYLECIILNFFTLALFSN